MDVIQTIRALQYADMLGKDFHAGVLYACCATTGNATPSPSTRVLTNTPSGLAVVERVVFEPAVGVVLLPSEDRIAIPMKLQCPSCNSIHVDEGEWATRVHHKHFCAFCGQLWSPCTLPTVGISWVKPAPSNPTPPRV